MVILLTLNRTFLPLGRLRGYSNYDSATIMTLHSIDIAIILVYLAVMVIAGVLTSRMASKSLDAYFLGDRKIPWYALSLSNAGGMFDISGTMWLVTLAFVYGLKIAFIPWLWPFFNQIIMMIYLAILIPQALIHI